MESYAEFLTVFSFFGSFWLTVIIITVTTLTYRHWRAIRAMDQGREIVLDMLQRKMTADEIERVLVAWSGNRALSRKVAARHAAAKTGLPAVETKFNSQPVQG